MIGITSFAIHVTYTCPLTCAHCCFSSSPNNKDRLPIAFIIDSIKAIAPLNLKMIAFTGGEPFLLGRNLALAVAEAARQQLAVRIVTSAHWATTDQITMSRLSELKASGLSELSISWDDYHEEFVDFDNVRRAFFAAKELGVTVAISIVQSASSRWTADRVRHEIGAAMTDSDIVTESPLNQTGRAVEILPDAGIRSQRFIGPCPYVLTGPTLSAKSKLLACCGVIPETDELIIDHNPQPETLVSSMERAGKSVLLNWLHLRGPYEIMKHINNEFEVDIPTKESIGGNCEACKILFETPKISRHIRESVIQKENYIYSELELLKSLGLLSSDGIMGLWTDGRTCIDTGLHHTLNFPSRGEN